MFHALPCDVGDVQQPVDAAEAKQAALRLGREDPVDPLLARQPEPDGTEALSGPELSLQRASALTEASSSLAETVAQVLDDPLLRLEP